MAQFIQQLNICLKGGQTITIPFATPKAEVLNPQIEAVLKALGDKSKADGNFLFQGQRVVLVRLADVSSADIVSLVRKEAEEEEKKAEA